MVCKGDALLCRFPFHGFQRNNDIPEFDFVIILTVGCEVGIVNIGERQDIGRLIYAAKFPVQAMHVFIIAQTEADYDFFVGGEKTQVMVSADIRKYGFHNRIGDFFGIGEG